MLRKELKVNAQRLLHRKYGSWSIFSLVPIVITFFFSIFLWSSFHSSTQVQKVEKKADTTTEYKSWRDNGTGSSSDEDFYGDDYNSGYSDGYEDGFDEGYDYGYEDGVYDSYYSDDYDDYFNNYWDDSYDNGVNLNTIHFSLQKQDTKHNLSVNRKNDESVNSLFRGMVKILFRLILFVFFFVLVVIFYFYRGIAQWAAFDAAANKVVDFKQIAKEFFSGKKGALKANGTTFLFSFLWGLLLIVPGIWKATSYSMTNYLLRREELTGKEALVLSQKMMEGYKLEYFILKCSFIPHYILCLATFGTAWLYVHPYVRVTETLFFEQVYEENCQALPYPS